MSKSYGEMKAILEFAKDVATAKGDKPVTRTKKEKSVEDLDPVEIIERKRRELQKWEAAFKDWEKINKKEDKKEPEKKWHEKVNTPQLAMLIILFVPIYMILLQKIIH